MNFNFRAFLKTLDGLNRDEIIREASQERRAAEDYSVGRGSKYAHKRQQQIEYISDLASFLYFVRNTPDLDMPYPEGYLNSSAHKNISRARNLDS